ncbi:MAG: hypothetical protein JXR63_02700 [Spirochaetales bacterium]|nr:hypothetical protein [Spirochaetales bacterium]
MKKLALLFVAAMCMGCLSTGFGQVGDGSYRCEEPRFSVDFSKSWTVSSNPREMEDEYKSAYRNLNRGGVSVFYLASGLFVNRNLFTDMEFESEETEDGSTSSTSITIIGELDSADLFIGVYHQATFIESPFTLKTSINNISDYLDSDGYDIMENETLTDGKGNSYNVMSYREIGDIDELFYHSISFKIRSNFVQLLFIAEEKHKDLVIEEAMKIYETASY